MQQFQPIDEDLYAPETFANARCKKCFILNKYLTVTLADRKELDAWMEANNFDPKTAKKDFKSQAGVWFCSEMCEPYKMDVDFFKKKIWF